MRFRFLGGHDAPDWMLAEISILSKMSSVRMKLICRQIVAELTGLGLSMDKLLQLTTSARINLSEQDVQALVATLSLIFASAAKHAVDPSALLAELEQLGLPKDVCTAIVCEYSACKDDLRAYLRTKILALPQVLSSDWRVDYLLASSAAQTVNAPVIQLDIQLSKPFHTPASHYAMARPSFSSPSAARLAVELDEYQLTMLLHELRGARELMASVVQS